MSYDKEKLIELISAYLDNELTPDEIVEVQELLSTNVEAQEIHTQLSQTANLFKSIDPVAPPAYLKQKIIRRINIQNRTSFLQRIKDKVSARKYNFPVLTYASASLILIFFIVYPITLMLEWPIDKLADVPFIAENDPYEFSRQDDMLEMYADAPELEEFDNDQSKMDEAPNGRFEKGEGNTRADKETIPEHSFAFNEKSKGALGEAQESESSGIEAEPEVYTAEKTISPEKQTTTQALPRARSVENISSRSRAKNSVKLEEKAASPGLAPSPREEGKKYFVDVVDAYFDHSIQDLNGSNGTRKTVISKGTKPRFSLNAESGSNENPIIYNSHISPILPTMDFTFDDHLANDFIMILGEVHISNQGEVLFFKIECPPAAKKLVEKYGDKLMETRLEPAVFNSTKVSVFYRFIANIYRNDSRAD